MVNKLNNTQINSRSYWSLMKTFLSNKKIPLIPPLYYENRFIRDFKEKTELLNCFFSTQCFLLVNHSKLPTSLSFRADKRLRSATFSAEDIGKIIKVLDQNKFHGHNISNYLLKICGNSTCKPLEMISSQGLTSGSFPSEWKKGNIVPIHKKNDIGNLINHRPVSLLSICGKIYERLIFKEMFRFFFWKTNLLHSTSLVLNRMIPV